MKDALKKLIIQIPCLNEAQDIATTISSIPRTISGVDIVEILVIDDGSTDATVECAREAGANHILSLHVNHGLARAFSKGLEESLRLGADIVVNFDGDNQYNASDIEALIAPIVSGEADMVLGVRHITHSDNYNPLKIYLHRLGRMVLKKLTGYDFTDPVTGFRAFSRQMAQEINIFSSFSYTTETLIAAAHHKKRIVEIAVHTNKTDRPSRLFKSIPQFIFNTGTTIIRTYAMYRPLRFFGTIGVISCALGLLPILRFLFFYIAFGESGKMQSLTLGGVLFITGIFFFATAILADISAHNRRLSEKILLKMKEGKE